MYREGEGGDVGRGEGGGGGGGRQRKVTGRVEAEKQGQEGGWQQGGQGEELAAHVL
jgi:hypothetical protein